MRITDQPQKIKLGTPVTILEAKKQLQIEPEFTADDQHIDLIVSIAIEKIEEDTNSDVYETSNVLEFEPNCQGQVTYEIYQSPLLSFTKLEKLTSDGQSWEEIPVTAYKVKGKFLKIIVEILETIETKRFRATYKTGFSDDEMPKVIKGAALIKIADFWDSERQGYTMNVQPNKAYESLISKHIRNYW